MNTKPSLKRYTLAWLVHILTASGVFFGLLSLIEIHQERYVNALWLMALTVLIDAVDGTFARLVKVKQVLPQFDGALLDNIVDYLNYVVTPCFFLYVKPDMLPQSTALGVILVITLTSAYQFCQADAKTPDHFFKGFPCYWNIVVFYMFLLNSGPFVNLTVLALLCVFIFIPIKYVYPSRLDYLTASKTLKILMYVFSIIFGITSAVLLWSYPATNTAILFLSLGYVLLYLFVSVYRTYYPMLAAKIAASRQELRARKNKNQ